MRPVWLLLYGLSVLAHVVPKRNSETWVTLWSTAPFQLDGPSRVPFPFNETDGSILRNTTVRQTARPSHNASSIRIKLSNLFSSAPLVIDHMTIAKSRAENGASVGVDSIHSDSMDITLGNERHITMDPGQIIETDPIDFQVVQGEDISLSIYMSPGMAGRPNITGHFNGQTSWFASGDQTLSEEFEEGTEELGTYFLSAVEGLLDINTDAIIVIGDSISDRVGVDVNSYQGWTDALAGRLQNNKSTQHLTVGNVAIGANTVFALPSVGEPAVERYERDVIGQAGVKYCIILEGINDIAVQNDTDPHSTFDRLKESLENIACGLRHNGIKAIGGTLLPFKEPPYGSGNIIEWTPEREQTRTRINEWIMTSGAFDAVIDFAAAVVNASEPTQLRDDYASLDFLHPNAMGYRAMADYIDIQIFD